MDRPTLNFKYKFSDDYNPSYINGAYGGVGPRREIIANFFLERPPIPYSESLEILENGSLGQQVSVQPQEHPTNMVRYVTTGIIMNLETAKSIYEWLGLHIKALEDMKEKE